MEKLEATLKLVSKDIQSQLGISDEVIDKMDKLYEGGILGGTIDTDVSFDIPQGYGSGTYSKRTWGVTIDGYFMITSPEEGAWHIIVKDHGEVIIDANNVHKGDLIPIHHKTGYKINLNMDAWWSEAKDTKLFLHIHATY